MGVKDLFEVPHDCQCRPARGNPTRVLDPGQMRATVEMVFLLSRPRVENVQVIVVLPAGARIEVHFHDDDSRRDVTDVAADLIVEYLLRGATEAAVVDGVEVADIEIVGTDTPEHVRLATSHVVSGKIDEIPSERFLPLLSAAITMAVSDAVAYERESAEEGREMPKEDIGSLGAV